MKVGCKRIDAEPTFRSTGPPLPPRSARIGRLDLPLQACVAGTDAMSALGHVIQAGSDTQDSRSSVRLTRGSSHA